MFAARKSVRGAHPNSQPQNQRRMCSIGMPMIDAHFFFLDRCAQGALFLEGAEEIHSIKNCLTPTDSELASAAKVNFVCLSLSFCAHSKFISPFTFKRIGMIPRPDHCAARGGGTDMCGTHRAEQSSGVWLRLCWRKARRTSS